MKPKADAKRCLTEARVSSFNGEMLDSKPAITSFYVYFSRHTFLLPVALRNECLTKADDRRCLTEARVSSFNGAMLD